MCKVSQYDKAASIIEQAIENCGENGDLFYILAQIYKLQNNKADYVKLMNQTLKFNSTLSVSPKLVKKELENFLN